MKHFLIVIHGIAFLSGISAITLFIAAYIKYKRDLIKYYIFFIGALGMLLLGQTILAYKVVNDIYSSILIWFIMILSYISCSYLIYVLPLFTYKLINGKRWEMRKRLYIGLALIPVVALIGKLLFETSMIVFIANFVLFAVILISIILIGKHFKKITNNTMKSCVKILLVFSIAFLPYMYLDTKTEHIPFLFRYFPYGLISVPIFYFVWNGVSIFWVIKYLQEKEIDEKHNNQVVENTFFETYKITNREKEVIGLLIQGHSYKEISEQLVVSMATVKTHIRHIYQKTEVKNKIELINIMNKENRVI